MGLILLISKALMKKSLRMTILIGIIFTLCLGGLISAISIQMSTYNLFEKNTEKNKAPHLINSYSEQILDLAEMEKFLDKSPEVESYYIQPAGEHLARVQVGKYDDIMVMFEEYSQNLPHDIIKVTKGAVQEEPRINEVWIPTGLAYRYSIKVGDKMIVNSSDGKKECVVSAIVFDSLFTSSMISPARVWVPQGQLSLWYDLAQQESVIMSVRLNDKAMLEAFKRKLDLAFPEILTGISVDYYLFKSMSNLFNDIVSIILLIASIILVLISGGIIFFVISGEIINDYTFYGVYKGLGFSNMKLKALNIWRYLILLSAVTPFGAAVAGLITTGIIKQYEAMTGMVGVELVFFKPLVMVLLIIAAIILLTVTLSMRKLKKLEPAKAIRFGYVTKEKVTKKRRKLFSNMSIELALREMGLHRFKSGMKVIIVSSFALIVFSVNATNASLSKSFTADLTIGAPECDIFLQRNNTYIKEKGDFVVKRIENTEGVSKVTPSIMSFSGAILTPEEKIGLMVFGYDSYDKETTLKVLEGRNPQNDYEACLTQNLMERLDKKLGDTVTLNIDGSESVFVITGSFQIMSNMGQSIRITTGAYKMLSPNSDYNWFAVSIDKEADVKAVKSELQRVFGGQMTVSILDEFIDNVIGNISQGINVLNLILITIMALICGTSLFNMIQLHIIENKKNYGIMKAMGMSDSMVNRIQYIKMLIIATLGIVVGLSVTVLFTPGLLSTFLASSGLHHVELNLPIGTVILTACFVYLIALGSSYIAVKKHRKINLRELIVE